MRVFLLASSCLALPLTAALAAGVPAKPCTVPSGASVQSLLAQAEIARGLAGTEAVGIDPASSCIRIAVRTPGTARLVELLLRGVKVPAEAVRFQVDSAAVPGGSMRRG